MTWIRKTRGWEVEVMRPTKTRRGRRGEGGSRWKGTQNASLE